MCQVGPGLASPSPPISVVPLISQIAGVPLSFCHRMSDLPSPLKSETAVPPTAGVIKVTLLPPPVAGTSRKPLGR